MVILIEDFRKTFYPNRTFYFSRGFIIVRYDYNIVMKKLLTSPKEREKYVYEIIKTRKNEIYEVQK